MYTTGSLHASCMWFHPFRRARINMQPLVDATTHAPVGAYATTKTMQACPAVTCAAACKHHEMHTVQKLYMCMKTGIRQLPASTIQGAGIRSGPTALCACGCAGAYACASVRAMWSWAATTASSANIAGTIAAAVPAAVLDHNLLPFSILPMQYA